MSDCSWNANFGKGGFYDSETHAIYPEFQRLSETGSPVQLYDQNAEGSISIDYTGICPIADTPSGLNPRPAPIRGTNTMRMLAPFGILVSAPGPHRMTYASTAETSSGTSHINLMKFRKRDILTTEEKLLADDFHLESSKPVGYDTRSQSTSDTVGKELVTSCPIPATAILANPARSMCLC